MFARVRYVFILRSSGDNA